MKETGLSESTPQREAYWSELDADKKADRMRLEVKRLQRAVDELQETVNLLRQHMHSGTGLVVTPLERFGQPCARQSVNLFADLESEKTVYF